MQTLEYRTADKTTWGAGPWQDEPDKKQWRDEATGLPCLIVRNRLGALCGYVGVTKDHPWHGKDYGQCVDPSRHRDHEGGDDGWHYACTPEGTVEVHGGLTFAAGCGHGEDESEGICHVPEAGEPDDVWWFGFDCSHSGDESPAMNARSRAIGTLRDGGFGGGEAYRAFAYVEQQIASLAKQIVAVAA